MGEVYQAHRAHRVHQGFQARRDVQVRLDRRVRQGFVVGVQQVLGGVQDHRDHQGHRAHQDHQDHRDYWVHRILVA